MAEILFLLKELPDILDRRSFSFFHSLYIVMIDVDDRAFPFCTVISIRIKAVGSHLFSRTT